MKHVGFGMFLVIRNYMGRSSENGRNRFHATSDRLPMATIHCPKSFERGGFGMADLLQSVARKLGSRRASLNMRTSINLLIRNHKKEFKSIHVYMGSIWFSIFKWE